MKKLRALSLIAAGVFAVASPSLNAAASLSGSRPNIIFILTDDQRYDSLDQMPITMAHGWRNFVNAFVPEPQCCPARASLLTGRLPSRTGVDTLDRGNRLDDDITIATMLKQVGYQTRFFGKYFG